jgi:hypothetical protein
MLKKPLIRIINLIQMKTNKKSLLIFFLSSLHVSAYAYKVALYECGNKIPTEKNCEKLCKNADATLSIEVNTKNQVVMSSIAKDNQKTPLTAFENCTVAHDKAWSCKTTLEQTHAIITHTETFDQNMYFSSFSITSFRNGKVQVSATNYCGILKGIF